MTPKTCPFEAEVLSSVKSGEWDERTHVHFQTCETCQEQIHVWELMQSLAGETADVVPAGAYGLIWLKARFMEKQQARKKAFLPLVAAQSALAFLAALAFLLMTNSNGPPGAWVTNLLTGSLDFGETSAILMLLFGLLFLVFSLAVTLASSTE